VISFISQPAWRAQSAQWEPFELLASHSGGLRGWQDAVVLRKT
jgi:hypothetical protein